MASKHTIYLTTNHVLQAEQEVKKNVFLFNENGKTLQAKWLKKTIELNDGCFVIMDHNGAILREIEQDLTRRRYYIEKIDLSHMTDGVSINPFDVIKDTSESHFLFLSVLHTLWDNADSDIIAMSNLLDAFVNCLQAMFADQQEKINIETLKKLVHSSRAIYRNDDGSATPMYEALFDNIRDKESMPCKYYAQFKKATGERSDEVAEKLAQAFDKLNENDMEMMRITDESLKDSFAFKTAFIIDVQNEEEAHTADLLFMLLNYFAQHLENVKTMFVLDDLNPKHNLINLPYWLKESADNDLCYIIMNNDLSEYKATEKLEKYFKRVHDGVGASVLVHKGNIDLDALNNDDQELAAQTYMATTIIPAMNINEQSQLLK